MSDDKIINFEERHGKDIIKLSGSHGYTNFDITVVDREGQHHYFEPQDDMTPVEAARLAQFFGVTAVVGYDAWLFIQQFGLQRHFVKR